MKKLSVLIFIPLSLISYSVWSQITVVGIQAEEIYQQPMGSPSRFFEIKDESELQPYSPSEFFFIRKQKAETREYWPKSQTVDLFETAKDTVNDWQINNLGQDLQSKKVLDEWKGLKPKLESVIQKEKELDELITYLDRLKKVVSNNQPPPRTVSIKTNQSSKSIRPECQDARTRDYVFPKCD